MTAVVVLLIGLGVIVASWRWGLGAAGSAVELTVAATLATFATVFNVVVPVSNVEATTTLVACTAMVLGLRSAVLVAVLAVVGTGAASGLGTWTGWQVAGFVLVAAGAALAGRLLARVPDHVRWPLLAAWVGVLTVVYDAAVTIATVPLVGTAGTSTVRAVGSLLLLGLPFTVTHVVGNVAMFLLVGPPLLHALGRARVRIDAVPGRSGDVQHHHVAAALGPATAGSQPHPHGDGATDG